jgi:site-specific DNA-methyltransferase (adenine-specific)
MADGTLSQIITGDCRRVMRSALAEPDSIDAIITDPPYGLGFMGKAWDRGVPGVEFWSEMLRVAKPGAHLLAFGGTRTHHRMMCAIEDAGWELRDTIMWVYGSGFPKSHNLGDGRGTALKPAWEPIIMARKPLVGTVAATVKRYGTGVLNIDLSRVPATGESKSREHESAAGRMDAGATSIMATSGCFRGGDPLGRWPANLIHDGSDEVLAAFPSAPGQQGDLRRQSHTAPIGNAFGQWGPKLAHAARIENDKSAARFFYCAKASRKDRDEGLDDLPLKPDGMISNTSGQHITRRDGGAPGLVHNHHPTVKPTELMRYLVRLVTPPGGTILDPFCGSGSTGKAAVLEWCNFIGIDLADEYTAIAERRIAHAQRQAA